MSMSQVYPVTLNNVLFMCHVLVVSISVCFLILFISLTWMQMPFDMVVSYGT